MTNVTLPFVFTLYGASYNGVNLSSNGNAQFGNRVNRGRGRQFQGSVTYTFANSALNAAPYSFTAYPAQIRYWLSGAPEPAKL